MQRKSERMSQLEEKKRQKKQQNQVVYEHSSDESQDNRAQSKNTRQSQSSHHSEVEDQADEAQSYGSGRSPASNFDNIAAHDSATVATQDSTAKKGSSRFVKKNTVSNVISEESSQKHSIDNRLSIDKKNSIDFYGQQDQLGEQNYESNEDVEEGPDDNQEFDEQEDEESKIEVEEIEIEDFNQGGQLNIKNNSKKSQSSAKEPKKRRSIVEQTHDIRSLLNKIFSIRGGWRVNSLAADFSDGFLFQELFNILYDEKIDCCLEGVKDGPNSKLLYEVKVSNWNKINAGICFNYFQQQFYFVQGTMLTLAKGKNNKLTAQALRELLIAMQGSHHNIFDDETDVRDIADLLRINI